MWEERELDLEDEELPEDEEEGETPESEDEPEDDEDESDADAEDSEDETSDEEDDEDAELVVTIGDEQPEDEEVPAGAPKWVKETREENRKLKKRLKELERGSSTGGSAQRKELGPKPKLADCDYDEAKHEAALDAWYAQKREVDEAERAAKDAETQQQREWDATLQKHVKSKGALKVKDYDRVEETVFEELNQTQQGIIISGAENSALVVLALGRNPKALKELAAIKDPVKYAFAIAKLETKLKTTKRRPATAPEGAVSRSTAGATRNSEATLAKLRAAAEKTGNYTKVNEYRRKMRARS